MQYPTYRGGALTFWSTKTEHRNPPLFHDMTDDDLLSAAHYGLARPSNTFPDPMVWRYMDILSLLSLLQTERLHFTRLSDLYGFDPNEGTGGLSINVRNVIPLPGGYSIPPTVESISRNEQELARVEAALEKANTMPIQEWKNQVKEWDRLNENVFINCWHTNEYESDFMWRVYAKREYGFAVTSYRGDLLDSFQQVGRNKIGYDYVVYPPLDVIFRDQLHETLGADAAFLIKHPDFEAERELRVFVRTKQPVKSCDLKVHLRKLVGGVHISPLVPDWAKQPLIETLQPICDAKGIRLFQREKPRLRDQD